MAITIISNTDTPIINPQIAFSVPKTWKCTEIVAAQPVFLFMRQNNTIIGKLVEPNNVLQPNNKITFYVDVEAEDTTLDFTPNIMVGQTYIKFFLCPKHPEPEEIIHEEIVPLGIESDEILLETAHEIAPLEIEPNDLEIIHEETVPLGIEYNEELLGSYL